MCSPLTPRLFSFRQGTLLITGQRPFAPHTPGQALPEIAHGAGGVAQRRDKDPSSSSGGNAKNGGKKKKTKSRRTSGNEKWRLHANADAVARRGVGRGGVVLAATVGTVGLQGSGGGQELFAVGEGVASSVLGRGLRKADKRMGEPQGVQVGRGRSVALPVRGLVSGPQSGGVGMRVGERSRGVGARGRNMPRVLAAIRLAEEEEEEEEEEERVEEYCGDSGM